jgi:uncharacterized iron-regulated protein
MEMFDHTYQTVLDRWSKGELEYDAFLKRTHWYANWNFRDGLYKEILLFIKTRRLKLVGLNIPFHLPRKIAVGGLESLSPSERRMLPERIDTANPDHRAYLEKVFGRHKVRGRQNFEDFYAAQCAWEDGMASAVAENRGDETMVVLAGNGHIVRRFGIPDRAFKRTGTPFRTIIPARPGTEVSTQDGDFIWVTAGRPPAHPPH